MENWIIKIIYYLYCIKQMSRNITYNKWLTYTRYEKQECDIKLVDGRIIKHVYPNAGNFMEVCGKTFEKEVFNEKDVIEIMYVKYYQTDLCKGNCNVSPKE